jgi:hypothetical protein
MLISDYKIDISFLFSLQFRANDSRYAILCLKKGIKKPKELECLKELTQFLRRAEMGNAKFEDFVNNLIYKGRDQEDIKIWERIRKIILEYNYLNNSNKDALQTIKDLRNHLSLIYERSQGASFQDIPQQSLKIISPFLKFLSTLLPL